jgi:cytochrome c oxidase subunit III
MSESSPGESAVGWPQGVPPLDVAPLPSYAFGHRSLMWWGTLGLMAIEGTVFALAVVTYLYLRTRSETWPPGVPPPDLRWGVVNTLILVASVVPNHWTKRAAEAHDLRKVRLGIIACLAFAVAFLGVRALEFATLNCRWDTNAYASAVWMLLALHTTHLLTDAVDTAVLGVLMFTGPIEGRRFVDVSENALYWYFVVVSWLPIAAIIYIAPRAL